MIDYNISKLKNQNTNTITVKHINLDEKLDFFVVIDSNKKDYVKIIENKILDFIIDKISIDNTYKDFSIALEKINNIIKTYNESNTKDNIYLNILVSVLNKNDFIFSKIGKSSLYLVKNTNETIEITEKKENKKEFNYIFEGNLESGDILILSTSRLLEYLSYSDFTDSAILGDVKRINKNIELILSGEKVDKNLGILTIKYLNRKEKTKNRNNILGKGYKVLMNLIDNNFTKIIIAYLSIAKEKIQKKSKLVKNLLLIAGIIVATILLFQILSRTIGTIAENDNSQKKLELLEIARKHKTIASDNYANSDVFNLNIQKSEDIISQLKEQKVFLDDLKILEEQLGVIKKTFNRVEKWEQNEKDLIYKVEKEYNDRILKVLKVEKKIYIITKKEIIGPIINTEVPSIKKFSELEEDEYIDATELKGSIILLTKQGKIVEFRRSGSFSFKDVLGQDTWQEAKYIKNYASNIYLISEETNQIFRHAKYGNSFKKAEPYLKMEDTKYKKILDVAIDGGFYILKNDLSLVKFFRSPYRVEKMKLEELPENYKKIKDTKIKIIARKDLNYFYILLNDRIWILKPNTKLYKQTKILRYLGQIESSGLEIKDFFVEKDGIIIVLDKYGIHKLSFNENDGRILVNN